MAKPTAGVAFLLIGMIAVTSHVTSLSAGVAELLSLLFGLLAVPGNMTTLVAVVACLRGKCASKEAINIGSNTLCETMQL